MAPPHTSNTLFSFFSLFSFVPSPPLCRRGRRWVGCAYGRWRCERRIEECERLRSLGRARGRHRVVHASRDRRGRFRGGFFFDYGYVVIHRVYCKSSILVSGQRPWFAGTDLTRKVTHLLREPSSCTPLFPPRRKPQENMFQPGRRAAKEGNTHNLVTTLGGRIGRVCAKVAFPWPCSGRTWRLDKGIVVSRCPLV